MKKILLVPGLVFLLFAAGFAMLTGPANADPDGKVYVCKYVGTPGVDEVLQTGNNPIEVSVSAIATYDPENPLKDEAAELVGDEFSDAQGRSIVIAVSAGPGGGQGDEPTIEDCPPPDSAPTCPEDSELNAGLPIPEGETEATFCFEEEEPPPTCPDDSEINAGLPIPDGQTAEEFCNLQGGQVVCPPGSENAGEEIPDGETAEEFCVAGAQVTVCPPGSDLPGEMIPEGQTAQEFCNEDNPPNPGGEQETPPEVAGEQQLAPMQPAAQLPTAVDAGL